MKAFTYVRKVTVIHKDSSISSIECGDLDYINPDKVEEFVKKHANDNPDEIKIKFW